MKITPTETDPLVADYLAAKTERDTAQAKLDEIGERLIKQMEQDQRKNYRWSEGGANKTLTYVQAYTTVIDETGLRKRLRAKTFDRYTKRVLDRRAMERAMEAGEVDPVIVSQHVTQRPNKPHLKYTETDRPEETHGEATDR